MVITIIYLLQKRNSARHIWVLLTQNITMVKKIVMIIKIMKILLIFLIFRILLRWWSANYWFTQISHIFVMKKKILKSIHCLLQIKLLLTRTIPKNYLLKTVTLYFLNMSLSLIHQILYKMEKISANVEINLQKDKYFSKKIW
jgi:hypothetical protein